MDFMAQVGSLSLGSRLKRLSDLLIQEVSIIYRRQGIELNPSYFPLFYLLYSQGPQSVTGAADALAVSHPAISKMATRMQAEGWLNKTVSPEDERRQLLEITPKGLELAAQIKPLWTEIRRFVDNIMEHQQHHLLRSLDEFEAQLQQRSFSATVLHNSRTATSDTVEIIDWDPAYRDHFETLNMAWLHRYFADQIDPRDRQALSNPESYYLARGGAIFFARYNNHIVGCCALERYNDKHFQLAKLGVIDQQQSRGTGRKLVLAALDKARQWGARTISLETSSTLVAANGLYRSLGFQSVPPPDGRFKFARADMYLELHF